MAEISEIDSFNFMHHCTPQSEYSFQILILVVDS